ncbi:MAG: transposase [Lentisphaerae bacterium RIFOXYA12_64_32]|nr:MAG: transposase [Lentisphaerae bacterium RIFOXYA12_64_32]
MSARFVDVDRQTPMFLPCDLRDWLPADHIVHFILDAVEQLPLHHFHVNARGTGSEQYPPALMLALLIYCYATGRFGSRTIEAATFSDVAVRYLCANRHPDHASICAFRTANEPAFVAAFTHVLHLAHQLRLTRLGSVSVDGSKIAANASKHAAVSYQRAGEMIAQLQLEVQELMTRAQQADAQETKLPGLDLPAELRRREHRVAALQRARQVIEERARELAAAQQPEYQAKVAARQAQRAAGKQPRGPEPVPPSAVPEPKAQYNFTDPESKIMKAGNGSHFEQAHNAQAAVDEAMLIVGARVSDAPNDKQELPASVAAISPVVAAEVKNILVDSGFYSEAAVATVEQKPGGTASGVTVYAAVAKHSHHKTVADLLPQPEPPAPGPDASAKEHMAHRLKTAVGQALYRLRKQTVEPVFGIIKEVMGFRRFRLRGRAKVSLEWTLVCLSYNLRRLFTLKNQAAAG